MLRSVVRRNEILRGTFKKTLQLNTARSLSVECTRRRHRNNQPSFLKPAQKLPWNPNYLRYYADLPPHIKIPLPALSPTMETGNIVSWEKKEGDKLNEGDLLAEIETDKATMGFETPEEGYLAKIVVPSGTKNVPVGKLVCIIVQSADAVAAFKDFKDDGAAPVAKPKPAATTTATPSPAPPSVPAAVAAPTQAAATSGERVYASPMAKRLAEQRQIRLQGKGTGLYDSITSRDVPAKGGGGAPAAAPAAAAKKSAAKAPAAGASFTDIPLTNMRLVIAKRLVESKQQIPHYYLTANVEVDKILQTRVKFNKALEKQKIKISVNDFIIKGVAVACRKVPEGNSQWMDSFIRQFNTVDVSVAVSTDKGLITPIVFGADSKGLIQISNEVKELAGKARANKLKPHEFQGGTVSISNLGMFGTDSFIAVINPPQAIILAVGTTQKKLVLDKENEDTGFKEIQYITVTISCDHRVVDGAVAARWLEAFRECMEDPTKMLL